MTDPFPGHEPPEQPPGTEPPVVEDFRIEKDNPKGFPSKPWADHRKPKPGHGPHKPKSTAKGDRPPRTAVWSPQH